MPDHPAPKAARPVRDCQHTKVHHEHGTRPAYVLDRCGCGPCTAANTASERRRTTAIVYGAPSGLVEADPTRRHVQELREAGLSLERIAALSGVGQGTVNALIYGVPARRRPPPAQVRYDTARRLLAVQFDPNQIAAGRRIDATGTHRRLQALATLGWTIPTLAVRAGLSARTLRRALINSTVTADTARTIAALYDHLRPHRRRAAHRMNGRRPKRQPFGPAPPAGRQHTHGTTSTTTPSTTLTNPQPTRSSMTSPSNAP